MQAVFLDRDGTIGGDGQGIHPNEFTIFDYASAVIKLLNETGEISSLGEYKSRWLDIEPDHITENLLDAAQCIRDDLRRGR